MAATVSSTTTSSSGAAAAAGGDGGIGGDEIMSVVSNGSTRNHGHKPDMPITAEITEETVSPGQCGDEQDAISFSPFAFRSASASLTTLTKARQEVSAVFSAAVRHSEKVTALLTQSADNDYNMNHPKRGICVIVNQKKFSDHIGLNERRGTDRDAENLKKTFKSLSFEVKDYNDLNQKELVRVLSEWQVYDHTECDAFAFCFLSHGERDLIYTTEGKIPTDDLFKPFTGDRCPTLVGKPKLFFIQACRGDYLDKGILATDQTDGPGTNVYRLPAHADFLICYSTVAGYYSWRNTSNGSWFVQALCDVLGRRDLVEKHDILVLMTLVNKQVAFQFESCVPGNTEMDRCKQVPCMTFTLTRKLVFSPKMQATSV